MNRLLKRILPTLCMVILCMQVTAQTILLNFTNRKVSADGLSWTFDVEGQGDPVSYAGPDNNNWQAYNIRMDLQLPAGVSILGGAGLGDPTYTTGLVGVQTIVPGTPPAGWTEMGVTISRTNQTDLNTSNFVHLATFTVNFSAPVGQEITVVPRPDPIISGSSWTNLSAPIRRPFSMTSSFPLPVKLVDFSAAREGNTTTLAWSTSEESNSDYFEVQRSSDAKVWEKLKSVVAKGESSVEVNYSAVDESPMNGNNFYRLKMVDKDGTFALSKIRKVEFDLKVGYTLFPNPVSDKLNFKSTADWKNVASIKIYNAQGVEVYTSPSVPAKEVNVEHLPSGTYVVKLSRHNGQYDSYKVVIAK